MDLINGLYIKKGETLGKRELKSRITQMGISLTMDDNLKDYYVKIYDNALKESENLNRIKDLLIKDTEEEKERLDKKRTRNDIDKELIPNISNLIQNKKIKMEEEANRIININQVDEHPETKPNFSHQNLNNNLNNNINKSEPYSEFVATPTYPPVVKVNDLAPTNLNLNTTNSAVPNLINPQNAINENSFLKAMNKKTEDFELVPERHSIENPFMKSKVTFQNVNNVKESDMLEKNVIQNPYTRSKIKLPNDLELKDFIKSQLGNIITNVNDQIKNALPVIHSKSSIEDFQQKKLINQGSHFIYSNRL